MANLVAAGSSTVRTRVKRAGRPRTFGRTFASPNASASASARLPLRFFNVVNPADAVARVPSARRDMGLFRGDGRGCPIPPGTIRRLRSASCRRTGRCSPLQYRRGAALVLSDPRCARTLA